MLAELNGPTHYIKIYNIKKLENTQKNDKIKIEKCKEKFIELHVINISNQKQFKEENSKIFLDTIINIINGKLAEMEQLHMS